MTLKKKKRKIPPTNPHVFVFILDERKSRVNAIAKETFHYGVKLFVCLFVY